MTRRARPRQNVRRGRRPSRPGCGSGRAARAPRPSLDETLRPGGRAAGGVQRPGRGVRHGQVRPCRAQDRRHPGLHRHPGLLRPSGGGQPWRPRHDRRRRRHPGAVQVRRGAPNWPTSSPTPALRHPADRHHRAARHRPGPRRRPRAAAAAAPEACPRAWRRPPRPRCSLRSATRWRSPCSRRGFTAAEFRRSIRAASWARAEPRRATSCTAATRCRSRRPTPDGPGDADDDREAFGCVGVVDDERRLIGMVTDGDLRRHMGPDLLGGGSGRDDPSRRIAARRAGGQALRAMNAPSARHRPVRGRGRPPRRHRACPRPAARGRRMSPCPTPGTRERHLCERLITQTTTAAADGAPSARPGIAAPAAWRPLSAKLFLPAAGGVAARIGSRPGPSHPPDDRPGPGQLTAAPSSAWSRTPGAWRASRATTGVDQRGRPSTLTACPEASQSQPEPRVDLGDPKGDLVLRGWAVDAGRGARRRVHPAREPARPLQGCRALP